MTLKNKKLVEIFSSNTQSGQKEALHPGKDGAFLEYFCGPTVDRQYPAISLRPWIVKDVRHRIQRHLGYAVHDVMNITDIGDFRKSSPEKNHEWSSKEVAEHYENHFWEDCKKLNIEPPTVTCNASAYISEIVDIVHILLKKGAAYKGKDGNIYLKEASMEQAPSDIVLWYSKTNLSDKSMTWDSDQIPNIDDAVGPGRPGGDIECVAMALNNFGNSSFVKGGRVGHIDKHHKAEQKILSALDVADHVVSWFHVEDTHIVRGGILSNKKGSKLTVPDLIEAGYDPLLFRYLSLKTHYKSKLDFGYELLDEAKIEFADLSNKFALWSGLPKKHISPFDKAVTDDYKKKIEAAFADDFDVPLALSQLWACLNDNRLTHSYNAKLELLKSMDIVLGLGLSKQNVLTPSLTKTQPDRKIIPPSRKHLHGSGEKGVKNDGLHNV
ncbi:MAG: hypothetical protein WC464_00790 [Bdellovibrionales bacterium]